LVLVIVFACLRRLPVDKEMNQKSATPPWDLSFSSARFWRLEYERAAGQARKLGNGASSAKRVAGAASRSTRGSFSFTEYRGSINEPVHSDEFGSCPPTGLGAAGNVRGGFAHSFPKGVPKGYKSNSLKAKRRPLKALRRPHRYAELKRWRRVIRFAAYILFLNFAGRRVRLSGSE